MANLNAMHRYVDLLESSKVGYDQGQRWSFNPSRNGLSVHLNSECDCSSSCAAIMRAGGIPVNTNDPIYTGNLVAKFKAAGDGSVLAVNGLSLDSLIAFIRPGDFLLGPGHVVYVREKRRWWSAESDERGSSSGGQAGDQSGYEARFRAPYARSRGWTHCMRPGLSDVPTVPPLVGGYAKLVVDGVLGPRTIRTMQHWLGVAEDGVWGPATTRALQGRIGVAVDGVRGPKTIRALQRVVGVTQDGVWGRETVRGLQLFMNVQIDWWNNHYV